MMQTLRTILPSLVLAASLSAAALAAAPVPDTPAALIARQLDAALDSRSLPGPREVALDNPMLTLPKTMSPETMRLDNLSVDARTGRLMALFAAAEGKAQLRVTGRFFQLVEAVVPARPIEAGEVIAERDLERATVRRDPAAQEPLAEAGAVVGKTPRHALRAHEAVSAADLQVPLAIHRGELVTMVLQTPLMTLSTQGQAMDDAVLGAALRVTNSKSHRIVEAVASGAGTVAVELPQAPR